MWHLRRPTDNFQRFALHQQLQFKVAPADSPIAYSTLRLKRLCVIYAEYFHLVHSAVAVSSSYDPPVTLPKAAHVKDSLKKCSPPHRLFKAKRETCLKFSSFVREIRGVLMGGGVSC